MGSKEILGIVPARGGSRGIPRKNLYPLCGRALIEYTFDAAKRSRCLSRLILTTDDQETAEVGKRNGIQVPFLRPDHLSQDDTPVVLVIQHLLEYLRENERYVPDIIVLLQPTSPLRKSRHIDEAVELLLETGADSVVSVVEVPHQYNPVSVMEIKDGRLVPFIKGEGTRILRRQDKPKVYGRNGAAVYVVTLEAFIKHGSLFGRDCRPYVMSLEESVDIDSTFDLKIAEMLIACEGGTQGAA
jgi:CMP-N-acetylneuraminic acid synthetase